MEERKDGGEKVGIGWVSRLEGKGGTATKREKEGDKKELWLWRVCRRNGRMM